MTPALRYLRLEPTSAAPGTARRGLAWLAPYLDPARLEDLRLVVTELVANAVEHVAHADGAPIEVDVAVADAYVRVDVRDGGASFTPPLPPPAVPRESVRGRGLVLVERLSDRFGVAGPSHLWVEVERGPASATLAR